jgi:DnaJ-class molecular chaperone
MSLHQSPYEVLGVPPEASDEEIRKAYRALCQIFHPDRFESSSTDVLAQAMRRMQEVNWAYNELRGADGSVVYYDTDGWTNIDRGRLTAKLLNREIPHRWNGAELSVDRRFENQVDKLM